MFALLPSGGCVTYTAPDTKRHLFTTFNRTAVYPTDESVTICVEGIEASAAVRDVELRLYYVYNGQQIVCDKVRITVMKVDSVQWLAKDSPLDGNPNAGGGRRMYPGKQSPSDGTNRREVWVQAMVKPAIAGKTVRFRAFDVDDPSTDAAPIDTNGANGGDNKPGGSGSLSPDNDETDTDGMAQVLFTVSMQPGDNFRIGAHWNLEQLSGVTNDEVPPNNNPDVAGQPGKYTEMLTVWRKLRTEVDSMGAPPPGTPWDAGDVPPPGGDVADPDTGLLVAAFEAAYVLAVFDTGNNNSNAAFIYNMTDAQAPTQGLNNRGTTAEAGDYWVAYIQGAYEGPTDRDHDPNGEAARTGCTFYSGPEYSFVYQEVLRDLCDFEGWDETAVERRTVIHEIGHQFELGHHGGCVMEAGPSPTKPATFCSSCLNAIRGISSP